MEHPQPFINFTPRGCGRIGSTSARRRTPAMRLFGFLLALLCIGRHPGTPRKVRGSDLAGGGTKMNMGWAYLAR